MCPTGTMLGTNVALYLPSKSSRQGPAPEEKRWLLLLAFCSRDSIVANLSDQFLQKNAAIGGKLTGKWRGPL